MIQVSKMHLKQIMRYLINFLVLCFILIATIGLKGSRCGGGGGG